MRFQLNQVYTRTAVAIANEHVMEMINDKFNPLTKEDLHRLADQFPERWERYRNLLDEKKND